MVNFYCSALYGLLKEPRDFSEKAVALRHLKAKIIRLNANYYHSMMVDNNDYDRFQDEPSLRHLLKEKNDIREKSIRYVTEMALY
jgi:hypothetical protein